MKTRDLTLALAMVVSGFVANSAFAQGNQARSGDGSVVVRESAGVTEIHVKETKGGGAPADGGAIAQGTVTSNGFIEDGDEQKTFLMQADGASKDGHLMMRGKVLGGT